MSDESPRAGSVIGRVRLDPEGEAPTGVAEPAQPGGWGPKAIALAVVLILAMVAILLFLIWVALRPTPV